MQKNPMMAVPGWTYDHGQDPMMAVPGWTYDHGQDPKLHQVAYYGDLEELKRLRKIPEHWEMIHIKNRLGCTPLRLAATGGHQDCVSYLIQQGAAVNVVDVKAQTPLFVAIKNKRADCVRVLLQHGANPNGDSKCLCTPVYVAAMEGFLPGLKHLIEYGADLDLSQASCGTFSTPLYISITYDRLSCFRELLLGGADPDFSCRKGDHKTTLHKFYSLYHVVVKCNVSVDYAQLLYDCGASLYFRDNKEQYAWQMLGHKNECREYLSSIHNVPRSLSSHCRIIIRRSLGRWRIKQVHKLPLPSKLRRYVQLS